MAQSYPTTTMTWKKLRVDPSMDMLRSAAGAFPNLYDRCYQAKANEEDIHLGAN